MIEVIVGICVAAAALTVIVGAYKAASVDSSEPSEAGAEAFAEATGEAIGSGLAGLVGAHDGHDAEGPDHDGHD